MPSASDIRAGGAFTELYSKNGPLYAGLKAAQRRIDGFVSGAMRAGQTMARLTAVVASPFVIGIKAASDMQETMSKFNVVFGDNAAAVKKWGDEYGAQVGRSKQQIADFLAGNQDLFVPMGFDAKSAEAISKTLTTLAVDLGSFNNKADADVMGDLQAAMTGSGEVMKKYGVMLNEAAVKAELLKQGMDPKDATATAKAQARLNIILAGTTAAQGDAIRTSGGFANQLKALKASAWDSAAAFGEAVLPAVTAVLSKIVVITKAGAQWIANNAGLVRILGAVVAVIAAVTAGLFVFAGAGTALSFIVGGISAALAMFGSVLGVAASVLGFLISPIGLVIAALAGLAGYFLWTSGAAGQAADWIMERFGQLAGFVKEVYGGIADAMAAGDMQLAAEVLWAGIRVAWTAGLAWIRQQWAELRFFLVDMWGAAAFGVLDIASNLWARVSDQCWDMVYAIADAWKWAEKTIAKGVGWIIAKLQGIDPADVIANLEADYSAQQRGRDAGEAQRKEAAAAANAARLEAIDSARQDWTAGAAAKRDATIGAASEDLEEAKRRFYAAKDAAKQARLTKEAATKGAAGPSAPGLPDFKGAVASQNKFTASGALGSAESFKILMGSRGDPALAIQKDQLATLAAIAKNTAAKPTIKEAVPPKR